MSDSRKRIALVCSPLAFNGGTFRHLLSWCRNLDRQKFKVALFCNFINAEHEQLARPHLNAIPELFYHPVSDIFPFGRLIRGGWLNFIKALRQFRPQLIHSVFLQADLLCAMARPLTGFPVQVSSWEGSLALKAFHSQATINLYKALLLPAQRMISRFVAISAATAAQNCSDFGIAAQKVRVIHSGLELAAFPFKPERNSRKIGLVSRLTSEKQIDVFIRAIPLIARHHPDYRFVIAGDGPERNRLEALAESCAVRGITDFVGWQTDVQAVLDELEIFAFTSSGEGLPWSILEAMAAGCPVVASAVGGIPEAIENGKTGLLVNSDTAEDFSESLIWLINNPEKRISIARQARKKVENTFSEKAEITAIEKLYCDLLL